MKWNITQQQKRMSSPYMQQHRHISNALWYKNYKLYNSTVVMFWGTETKL